MDQRETVRIQLEQARLKLYQLALQYGIRHGKVMEQSLIVDKLINLYNRMQRERIS